MAQNRECVVCKTRYEYCPHCNHDINAPSWKAIYDSENCKKIFDACSAYVFKHINASEALSRLNECDLSKENNFAKGIKKNLADIRASVPVVVEKEVKPAEIPEENIVPETELISEEIVPEIPVVESAEDDIVVEDVPKPKRRNRNNRNRNVE